MPKTSYYGNYKINKGVRLMRMVMCSKLKKELEGLDRPSYPGELGKKVFDNISKDSVPA